MLIAVKQFYIERILSYAVAKLYKFFSQQEKNEEIILGKILLILGVLGILLGGGVAIVSLILPQMTRNVSMSEASIGIIAGAVVLVLSFVPAIIGLILVIVKRNKLKNQV
jgi:ABC-type Fe3+-siderophore transport system permease subunit